MDDDFEPRFCHIFNRLLSHEIGNKTHRMNRTGDNEGEIAHRQMEQVSPRATRTPDARLSLAPDSREFLQKASLPTVTSFKHPILSPSNNINDQLSPDTASLHSAVKKPRLPQQEPRAPTHGQSQIPQLLHETFTPTSSLPSLDDVDSAVVDYDAVDELCDVVSSNALSAANGVIVEDHIFNIDVLNSIREMIAQGEGYQPNHAYDCYRYMNLDGNINKEPVDQKACVPDPVNLAGDKIVSFFATIGDSSH
ncbi:hypothetical protein PG996_014929 [Apiospora saccharicola]|uniref:Uncharacterized protein n=1 Tax=Apiospora saccharicola TaxID=335842 RepID=A0ABR1TLR6_9PEZI